MSRRETIQKNRRPLEPLCVSDWGEGLFVRRMGARRKLELEDWKTATEGMSDLEKSLDAIAKLVVFSVVETGGEAAFKPEDLDWLKEEDDAVLMAVFYQALAANKMRTPGKDGKGADDLDDAKKNSAPDPSAASSSSCAEPSTTAA